MWMKLFAIVGALIVSTSAQTHSPCPDLFQYVSQEPGQWVGDLTLLSEAQLHGIWVRIILDAFAENVTVENGVGEIEKRDDEFQYLLKNRDFILKPGEPLKARICVKYGGKVGPKLVGFRLNARTVCPEHGGEFNWVDSSGNENSNELFLGDLSNKDFLAARPAAGSIASCGTVPLFPGALAAGKKASEGQWPWSAFVYVSKGDEQKKVCGATLISPTHLITAAHCLTPKSSGSAIHPDHVLIRVGEHFAKGENKGMQEAHVIKVTLHPGYNSITLDNDLAMIRLDSAVTVTDYVRPVCLWEEAPNVQSVLRRQGVVVGLGFDKDGRYTDRLTHTALQVLMPEVCSNSKPEIVPFLTGKSLCAGYTKGNNICVGESGSGVSFLSEGPKPVWQLRGLVTVGAGLQNNLLCDEKNYIILTDLAKHTKWIQSSLV